MGSTLLLPQRVTRITLTQQKSAGTITRQWKHLHTPLARITREG